MKLAKNIRFAGKRLQLGVDIYNIFNSDAITGYNGTYTDRQPGDARRSRPTTGCSRSRWSARATSASRSSSTS